MIVQAGLAAVFGEPPAGRLAIYWEGTMRLSIGAIAAALAGSLSASYLALNHGLLVGAGAGIVIGAVVGGIVQTFASVRPSDENP
ncbi:MAG: hypothetical protein E7773_14895 [Sphingomonas sp.]|uniref:hypothetical protein n=1 Tax=Sphingomonas sp. TaxID=28214 RepID=UPI0011F956A9|nr:hypothetical protein [Sphingomonas sp.]THD34474.1 MAG: hypothetical protein E7773_14895 [Sphingomonas sp.]